MGLPTPEEAAPYFFRYIDRVRDEDIVGVLQSQMDEALALLSGISEEKSLYRYAPDKWSLRELLNHLSDTERLFLARAFWFARGFDTPLPSFDEKVCAAAAQADKIPWARHVEEFRTVRLATLSFFHNLPAEAWMRTGTASDNPFTVNALAYLAAGHVTHHLEILRERYL
ncbi:MAG TPA: DinB family protein [Thermoanaerobaculia bacterium]|nr:DinB family protein [Thermoanaerobaculia bacterium]